MDTNSELDTSVKLDTSEPGAPRAQMDSVTAVCAIQKLVTGNQSMTKLKLLSRRGKNNFLRVLLDTGSDDDLMVHKKDLFSILPT